MMEEKRKKVIAYLHPDIYAQDALAQDYIESLPSQTRGEFNRNALICGAALCTIDPRIMTIISALFSKDISAENVMAIIEQVTGFKSTATNSDQKEPSQAAETPPFNTALQNLSMLKK
jgi:Plasmid stability protein